FLGAGQGRAALLERIAVAVRARLERRQPRRRHPPLGHQPLGSRHVPGAPVAPLPARREPDDPPLVVNRPGDAVDPAPAERLLERLLVADPLVRRVAFVKADMDFTRRRMMLLEPAAPVDWRAEEACGGNRRGRL